jgi:hypothetical protein
MKKWFKSAAAAAVLAASLLCGPTAVSAHAQFNLQAAGNPDIAGMMQELMKGLNIGPMMMSFGGASGNTIDFTRSNERVLLKRDDVRSELFIDSKQREQLTALDTEGKQQMQQVVMQSAMKAFIGNPDLQNIGNAIKDSAANGSKPDLGPLKDALSTGFQAMQESLNTFQTAEDAKSEQVLRPKQIKRLRELDLQYRGLLALSDKKVADELKATQEQRGVADAALKAYMDEQLKALQPVMNQAAQIGQQAAQNGGQPPANFNPQAIQKTVNDAMNSDALKKARSAAEAKIKASLTADQLDQWKKMLGEKFVFRVLEPRQ